MDVDRMCTDTGHELSMAGIWHHGLHWLALVRLDITGMFPAHGDDEAKKEKQSKKQQ